MCCGIQARLELYLWKHATSRINSWQQDMYDPAKEEKLVTSMEDFQDLRRRQSKPRLELPAAECVSVMRHVEPHSLVSMPAARTPSKGPVQADLPLPPGNAAKICARMCLDHIVAKCRYRVPQEYWSV